MRVALCCCAVVVSCLVALPRNARAQSPAGADIYRVKCAMCHGPQGRGDGPMASSLNPRPVDFTDAAKRLATTDSAVAEVIRRGRRAMPAFGSTLKPTDVAALVVYLKTLHR